MLGYFVQLISIENDVLQRRNRSGVLTSGTSLSKSDRTEPAGLPVIERSTGRPVGLKSVPVPGPSLMYYTCAYCGKYTIKCLIKDELGQTRKVIYTLI
jgi:hypothetical protein